MPMMWTWYNDEYLGGIHGVAGILNTIIEIKEINQKYKQLIENMLNICYKFQYKIDNNDDRSIIKPRNYAATIESIRDKNTDYLVQYCHGATGYVFLYCNGYQKFEQEQYLQLAIAAQEVVWQRGMLTKGSGLCHAMGGNGYTFLSIYRILKKKKSK